MSGAKFDVMEISEAAGLDPITVLWRDDELGRGSVTITCYRSAWTTYFAAMGGMTIREFFLSVGAGYLTDKLIGAQFLKQTKQHEKWLRQIICAVKERIAEGRPEQANGLQAAE